MATPIERKKYDSFIIWLYNQNKENLIPAEIKDQIPCSTASGWRNHNYSNYYGHEVRQMKEDVLKYYELFEKHKTLKRTFNVIAKVWINISNIIMPKLHKCNEHQELIINEIQRLFTVFDKKMVYKLARISATAFNTRLNILKVKCGVSPLSLCLKRHPLQLASSEVNKIKALFQDKELKCWPAISLYYKGVRDRELYISKSTFYNYINILGLNRKWKKEIKKKTGIISKMPNEYLHVDTTFWKLSENVKAAIVFVSDNFSKKVLGWSVSLNKDANNVKQALEHAIATIHQYHPKHLTTILVADGGSENHNMTIDELLRETTHPEISKIIAMKDISFSNSPVEAINKIIKRYLRIYMPD